LLLFLGLPLGWKVRLFPCFGKFCGSTICMVLCFFAALVQSREVTIKIHRIIAQVAQSSNQQEMPTQIKLFHYQNALGTP